MYALVLVKLNASFSNECAMFFTNGAYVPSNVVFFSEAILRCPYFDVSKRRKF